MIQAMWIGTVMVVGGLMGLRQGWRRQMADTAGCALALGLAHWQYPRLVPYVETMWPAPPTAARQMAPVYLFVALYGLAHAVISLYVPDGKGPAGRRWIGGIIGAVQAGLLAVLALVTLPYLLR
jgi:uncharacterized membrane protein required for colicin V production